jgi:hypothetical protein
MEKILVTAIQGIGFGQAEVDGSLVPDTEGLFALTQPGPSDYCDLTHVGSGLTLMRFVSREVATRMAYELYAACPEGWRQTGPAAVNAINAETPPLLRRWFKSARAAIERDIPLVSLRSYEEYRAAVAADNAGHPNAALEVYE